MTSRRQFIRTSGAGLLAGLTASTVPVAPTRGRSARTGLRLGVASYSLRELSRADAIKVIGDLRTPFVCVKSFHLPYDASPDDIAMARAEFAAAGIEIVGGGLVPLNDDDDTSMRAYFEYAKAAGFPLMVISATPESLPRIERFVKEYDIKVAIHNHGPEDGVFPAPSDALALIRDYDPRVGLCVDVGHTARTGRDVVREITDAGARVLDVHMKDLADLAVKESQCIVGEGAMPVPQIFRALESVGFTGYVNLEYEIDADNPAPGMLRSFAFMRGVLAGLGAG